MNCYTCTHKRDNAYTHHIGCQNPDPFLKGSDHGIKHGWFVYPICFDPVWIENTCRNYTEGKGGGELDIGLMFNNLHGNILSAVSGAISGAISDAVRP